MRVCIFGSCVSRDIFNCAEDGEADILLYSARSSLGSIYATRPFEDTYSALLKSPFQRRVVEMDLRKTVMQKFARIDPDVILIDLIDERFALMEASPGGRFTLSAELRNALRHKAKSYREIPSGSDEFFRHWKEGWESLLKDFDLRNMRERILINKVYWQEETIQGESFDVKQCKAANDMLEEMYEYQKLDLDGRQFIEYGDLLACPDDHQWGPAPFHFSTESHRFALNMIRQHVKGSFPPAED